MTATESGAMAVMICAGLGFVSFFAAIGTRGETSIRFRIAAACLWLPVGVASILMHVR